MSQTAPCASCGTMVDPNRMSPSVKNPQQLLCQGCSKGELTVQAKEGMNRAYLVGLLMFLLLLAGLFVRFGLKMLLR